MQKQKTFRPTFLINGYILAETNTQSFAKNCTANAVILQIFCATPDNDNLQTSADSQISAMAYLDLILRSVTEPGLLKIFIQFLLDNGKFDGNRMLDILIERINSSDTRVKKKKKS